MTCHSRGSSPAWLRFLKQSKEIAGGSFHQICDILAAQSGEERGGISHERGLTHLAAMGEGREEWRVGLYQ
jgi:hypothetical protein